MNYATGEVLTWTVDDADVHRDPQPNCRECGDVVSICDPVIHVGAGRFEHYGCTYDSGRTHGPRR